MKTYFLTALAVIGNVSAEGPKRMRTVIVHEHDAKQRMMTKSTESRELETSMSYIPSPMPTSMSGTSPGSAMPTAMSMPEPAMPTMPPAGSTPGSAMPTTIGMPTVMSMSMPESAMPTTTATIEMPTVMSMSMSYSMSMSLSLSLSMSMSMMEPTPEPSKSPLPPGVTYSPTKQPTPFPTSKPTAQPVGDGESSSPTPASGAYTMGTACAITSAAVVAGTYALDMIM